MIFNKNYFNNNNSKLDIQNGKIFFNGSIHDKRKQLFELVKLKNMIIYKYKQKIFNSYNPVNNNKKLLLLMATHTDNELRLKNILNTLKYFDTNSIDIMIANSKSLKYNDELTNYYKSKNISYYEIENNGCYDFGKWMYLLSQIDYSLYDYVFFINDSFIIEKPITHFINLAIKTNVELYGYNDSTQENYHYQSYFFCVRSDAINKFINMYNSKKYLIKTQRDVITHFELKMIGYFSTHDCYLKIGNFSLHKGQNIFFTSDFLYKILKKNGVLPFVKLKRITNI
jgi:hypothetical protein